jgi:TP901 family phage tail tape measure protein
MSDELADLYVTLRSVTSPLTRGFQEAAVEGESFAAKTGSWQSALTTLGAGAALVGVAVAGVSIKMAADWQASMVRLSTSAGETGGLINNRLTGNLAQVSDGLLKMAVDTATSTGELAKGMYMVESAGFHGAAGLTVMKAAAEGAKAEGAPLQEMANALTSALKSYNMGADQSISMTNQMIATVGSGKMTMSDFASSISTVLPIAASAHLAFAQVGGAMATMTNHGTSAEHATQELAFAIRNLEAPNNVAIKTMAALGLNSNDVSQKLGQRGLTGTLSLLEQTVKKHEGTDGLVHIWQNGKEVALTFDGAMKKMMGGAVGLNTALMLGGDNAKSFTSNVATVGKAAGGAGKDVNGWAEITRTFNFQLNALKELVVTTGIKIGTVLIPPVSDAIRFFTQHTAVTKAAAVVIGGILLGAITALTVQMGAMAVETIAATWPFLLIGAAIAALVAGVIYAYQHWSWFRDVVNAVGTALKTGFQDAVQAGIAAWHWLQSAASDTAGFFSAAASAITGVWNDAIHAGITAWHWLQTAVTDTLAFFQALPGRIMAGLQALPGLLLGWAKRLVDQLAFDFGYGLGMLVKEAIALPGQIMGGLAALWGLVTGLFGRVKDWLLQTGVNITVDAINWSRNTYTAIVSWFQQLPGRIASFLTALWHDAIQFGVRITLDSAAWARNTFTAVTGWFAQLPGRVMAFITGLPGQIKGVFASAGSWLYNAGRDVVMGLVHGLQSAAGNALGAVKNLGSNMLSGFKSAMGISSPSRVFAEAGRWIPAGIAQGITANMGQVHAALAGTPTTIGTGSSMGGGGTVLAGGGGYSGGYGGGSGTIVINLDVKAEVDGQQLFAILQQRTLRHERRNLNNGLTTRGLSGV